MDFGVQPRISYAQPNNNPQEVFKRALRSAMRDNTVEQSRGLLVLKLIAQAYPGSFDPIEEFSNMKSGKTSINSFADQYPNIVNETLFLTIRPSSDPCWEYSLMMSKPERIVQLTAIYSQWPLCHANFNSAVLNGIYNIANGLEQVAKVLDERLPGYIKSMVHFLSATRSVDTFFRLLNALYLCLRFLQSSISIEVQTRDFAISEYIEQLQKIQAEIVSDYNSHRVAQDPLFDASGMVVGVGGNLLSHLCPNAPTLHLPKDVAYEDLMKTLTLSTLDEQSTAEDSTLELEGSLPQVRYIVY